MTINNLNLQDLLDTITQLRSPHGCPWDKKQTPDSMIKYLNSEVDELISGIIKKDTENICEELGDVLYILVMITKFYQEKSQFGFSDVITQVNQKLIRRHPHVFAGQTYKNEADLKRQWQEIKAKEKQK